ncbi:NUDIX domain-containing protein [Anaerocolumna sedimenticola]|uniref:NUDIX domain-containing protein n=1 Tax=Anaerocolumna sedimenticola TaxID=2696063 RepID=A0A6P1TVT2_9FIRM|nr:NUDIX domain-containing protein [Anaerocolumna sedimenticola]QHQ63525.1 NUDIX domain-containing protein [Anaerocolumna sedimenticola]
MYYTAGENASDYIGILDRKNYDKKWDRITRVAIRGIIESDGKIALIHSGKNGEYKFPGGGMEAGESREETLIREVLEETGLMVVPETIKYYGKFKEIKKDNEQCKIFEQLSYYYYCDILPEKGERKLDDYEEEYGYELKWTTLEEAIENNTIINHSEHTPWIFRDTLVMDRLKEQKDMQS